MNEDQRKILKFLKKQDASKFSSRKEIAEKAKISETTVGSECYKMREEGYVEPGLARFNEPLDYRITVSGQNKLDDEKTTKQNLSYTAIGVISSIIISTVALLVAIFKP